QAPELFKSAILPPPSNIQPLNLNRPLQKLPSRPSPNQASLTMADPPSAAAVKTAMRKDIVRDLGYHQFPQRPFLQRLPVLGASDEELKAQAASILADMQLFLGRRLEWKERTELANIAYSDHSASHFWENVVQVVTGVALLSTWRGTAHRNRKLYTNLAILTFGVSWDVGMKMWYAGLRNMAIARNPHLEQLRKDRRRAMVADRTGLPIPFPSPAQAPPFDADAPPSQDAPQSWPQAIQEQDPFGNRPTPAPLQREPPPTTTPDPAPPAWQSDPNPLEETGPAPAPGPGLSSWERLRSQTAPSGTRPTPAPLQRDPPPTTTTPAWQSDPDDLLDEIEGGTGPAPGPGPSGWDRLRGRTDPTQPAPTPTPTPQTWADRRRAALEKSNAEKGGDPAASYAAHDDEGTKAQTQAQREFDEMLEKERRAAQDNGGRSSSSSASRGGERWR
ncbi:hypothetical protein QBC39DRAFT_402552, partial [Podospora conica]